MQRWESAGGGAGWEKWERRQDLVLPWGLRDRIRLMDKAGEDAEEGSMETSKEGVRGTGLATGKQSGPRRMKPGGIPKPNDGLCREYL